MVDLVYGSGAIVLRVFKPAVTHDGISYPTLRVGDIREYVV